jgi:hypothetical protein
MSNDGEAIAELAAVSDADAAHLILHYVYLPSSEAAAEVAGELRSRGFDTEERLGADGANWLVLARHVAVPSKDFMVATRLSMESLVAERGGEYDGWEVDVRLHSGGSHIRH